MQTVLQDLRYALRLLRNQPSFTLIALLALAIGIGANTAIFSVVNSILLRPLKFPEPDRIMVMLGRDLRSGSTGPVAPATYYDLRREAKSFEDMAAAEAWSAAFGGQGVPEQVPGLRMTASTFRVLRAKPKMGRVFDESEEEPGRDRVIVLSHGLWQRRFGGDPRVVGTTTLIRGESYEIAGVMGSDFAFPPFWASKAEAWVPLAFTSERKASRRSQSLRVFGRLASGVTQGQAQAEAGAIAARLAAAYPDSNTNLGVAVTPMHEMVVGRVRRVMLLLLGAVGCVLLIACANVANLLLTRSLLRRKELAVRLAIGAGRGRIVRQLLTESVLLSVVGGVLGLGVAYWGVDAIQSAFANAPAHVSLPRLNELGVDSSVLLFTLGISVLTGVLFGIAPALQAVRPQLSLSLRETARSLHGGVSATQIRNALVTAQVALTLMLLIGAGLLARSFMAVTSIDPGFRHQNVLTAVLHTTGTSVSEPARQVQFYSSVLEKLSGMPGVESAAAVNHLPLAGDVWSRSFLIENRPIPAPGEQLNAVYRIVSSGFFSTMNIPIRNGREFSGADAKGTQPVVVINETMAKRYWPAEDVVGKRIKLGNDDPWLTVVGVARNVKQRDWIADSAPEIYLPILQHPDHFSSQWSSSMSIVLRTGAARGPWCSRSRMRSGPLTATSR